MHKALPLALSDLPVSDLVLAHCKCHAESGLLWHYTGIKKTTLFASIPLLFFLSALQAAEDSTDLAKKLANPVAALISVPIQANYDDAPGAGVRYWAESPRGGPEGWGLRLNLTLLFPK